MDQAVAAALEPQVTKSLGVLGCLEPTRTYEGDGPLAWNGSWSVGTFRGFGGSSGDFNPVNSSDAIRLAAVLACIDVLAQDIASAPLTLNRVLQQGSRRRGFEQVAPRAHPLAKLFWTRPNDFMTWFEFTSMLVYHLALVDNAYIICVRDRMLRTTALIPVLPARVVIDVVQDGPLRGEIFYRVQASTAAEAAQYGSDDEIILFPDQMIHVRTRFMNGLSGLPTLAVGSRVIALSEAVTRFQDRVFRRDGALRGVFEQKEGAAELSQPQYDRLKASLGEAMNLLRDLGYPLVLEGGMSFKSISMTAAEAGAKEAFSQQIAETARLFRIPPHKLMHFESVKYDNMDAANRVYVRDSLLPRVNPIEQRLSQALLSEDEQMDLYVEVDRSVLNQSSPQETSVRVTKEWAEGLLTKNEARELLGYNPAKEGDVYKMAANTFLIDENHEVIVTNQASPGDPGAQANGDNSPANNDTSAGN
jgi:HK97 family phage portal protein